MDSGACRGGVRDFRDRAELGDAFGIAVLGSIDPAVYRNEIAVLVPSKDADAARKTPGVAVETAASLPTTLAAQLLDTAHTAFISRLQVAAGFTAVLVLAVAA